MKFLTENFIVGTWFQGQWTVTELFTQNLILQFFRLCIVSLKSLNLLKWRSDLIVLVFLKIQEVLTLILLLLLIRCDFFELQVVSKLCPWAGVDVFPAGIRQPHTSESEVSTASYEFDSLLERPRIKDPWHAKDFMINKKIILEKTVFVIRCQGESLCIKCRRCCLL